MSMSAAEILAVAMELDEEDRIMIADALMDSMPCPPGIMSIHDPDFIEELERRANDGSAGIPAKEVLRSARKRLREDR